METSADPCGVCGGNETKLIDGFYYCVECGTQNTNVRETILEERILADGTFAHSNRKKIIKIQKEGIEMSGEWYKWHVYNFIISGLADELIALGAKSSFKIKLLWIWTRYIKKYQNKSELNMNGVSQDENNQSALPSFMAEQNSNPVEEISEDVCRKKVNRFDIDGSSRDIKLLSKGVIVAMLYLALNLDKSDIQLSNLYRFIVEKHLNISNVNRFIPADINIKKIPNWKNFMCSRLCTQHQVRALAMSLLRKLKLGPPKIPNLRQIVDNFISELSLPNDMKPFVYSLIHFRRCDFLDIDEVTQKRLIRMPDYEGTVMAFVVVALKICFGLDGNYEVKLSNVVEKVNEERNYQKSYRIGRYSEPSNRLFSFREWCSYLEFRKIILVKHNLNIANNNFLDTDDYVYLEHMEERPKNNEQLTDKISIEIINKLPQEDHVNVIPKKNFLPSLTPMYDYTDIVIDYYQDPEVKLLLAEDFRNYSLKYACEYLSFLDSHYENIISGVSNDKKTKSNVILGSIVTKKANKKMVYVKNCENRNWTITNPPTIEHVTTVETEDEQNDKDSDHGYDSGCSPKEKEMHNGSEDTVADDAIRDDNIFEEKVTKELEIPSIILEEHEHENIFDDCFDDLTFKEECEKYNFVENHMNEDDNVVNQLQNMASPNVDFDQRSDISNDTFVPIFNPDTFDRENTIKELILFACKKYKIAIPAEYRTREPRKRKQAMFNNEVGTEKRRKRAKYDGKFTVENILSSYHNHVQLDFVTKIQQEMSLAIRNSEHQNQTLDQSLLNNTDLQENTGQFNTDRNSPINGGDEHSFSEIADKTGISDGEDVMNENVENELFQEDKEMNLDDLIPKGDPKFNEDKYDIDQLYIEVKDVKSHTCFDIKDDPDIDKILSKNVEEIENDTKLVEINQTPKEDSVESKEESNSEDETPLSVIKEEIMLIEEMYRQEESFERLIKSEDIPEFKYWVRHYDRRFMDRSIDLHVKFNEELKENVPLSFYFVLQECASILNCTNFYLYKQLQLVEEYIICKSKKLDFDVDATSERQAFDSGGTLD